MGLAGRQTCVYLSNSSNTKDELWGGGGPPFKAHDDSTLVDRAGNRVQLLGITSKIMVEMKKSSIQSAFVSTCDEPTWAAQCLEMFKVKDGSVMGSCVEAKMQLVYKV